MTHTWLVVAFIVLVAAAVVAAVHDKSIALALIAAGLALWLLPAAFQLAP